MGVKENNMSVFFLSILTFCVSVNYFLLPALGFDLFSDDDIKVLPKKAGRQWFAESESPCPFHQFRCWNGHCIDKKLFCNSRKDCTDNSDEVNCRESTCTLPAFFICRDNLRRFTKCISNAWVCDGSKDCPNGEDEQNCKSDINGISPQKIQWAMLVARNWTLNQRRNDIATQKWGSQVARTAVALYLTNENFFPHEFKDEITYELALRVLSRMALRKIEDVPAAELASYVHAFLVTCVDPRKFYVVDLVKELRKRLNSMKTVNPFVTLALCNAGEKISDNDVEKLVEVFWIAQQKNWIDTQAFVIMALSCAAGQNPKYLPEIKSLALEIKEKQYRNGTVENLKTTALVMQALLASESEPDENNFDEPKALKQILLSQQPDGSFGDLINTYYVLPVLRAKSLVNISTSHCKMASKDDKEGIDTFLNQLGPKSKIQYSLWIGVNKTLGTTLSLDIPANISFYRAMEYAADIDQRYKFKYNMRNGKPYIYFLWDKQDDPELNMFWIPFSVSSGGSVEQLTKSPSDIIPTDKQHLVFWYKSEALSANDNK